LFYGWRICIPTLEVHNQEEEMVAVACNHTAGFGCTAHNICAEQRAVAIHLCDVLNRIKK